MRSQTRLNRAMGPRLREDDGFAVNMLKKSFTENRGERQKVPPQSVAARVATHYAAN
jgi:hypothetical protein